MYTHRIIIIIIIINLFLLVPLLYIRYRHILYLNHQHIILLQLEREVRFDGMSIINSFSSHRSSQLSCETTHMVSYLFWVHSSLRRICFTLFKWLIATTHFFLNNIITSDTNQASILK